MATSGSTNYATDRNTLIKGALRICGAIAQGETPTSDQYTEAAEALNYLTKAYMAEGMPLWAIKQYTVTLTNAAATYNIGEGQTVNTPKPMKIIQAFLHNTSTSLDIPLTIVTRDQYNLLGNKTQAGQPVQIFYEPLRTYGVLHVYPVPDTTVASDRNIVIVYQRPFEDFDTSTDEPDFPQEWFDALKFGLADRLAPEYGVPIEDRNDIKSRARQLKDEALSFGTEEGSMYFQVERRGW